MAAAEETLEEGELSDHRTAAAEPEPAPAPAPGPGPARHDTNALPPKPPTDLSKATNIPLGRSPSARHPFPRSSPNNQHQHQLRNQSPSYCTRSPSRTPSRARNNQPDYFRPNNYSPDNRILHHRNNNLHLPPSSSHSPRSHPLTRSPSREHSLHHSPRSTSDSTFSPSSSLRPPKRPRPISHSRSPSPSKNTRNYSTDLPRKTLLSPNNSSYHSSPKLEAKSDKQIHPQKSPLKPAHQNQPHHVQHHSDQHPLPKRIRPKFQNYQPTFFFHRSPNPTTTNTDPSNDDHAKTKKYFVGVSSIESYELIEKLGEGTFGEVFKGIYRGRLYAKKQKLAKINQNPSPDETQQSSDQDSEPDDQMLEHRSKVKSGMVVALKRIIVHNELDGLPITALREIRILKSLDHPNIVPVVDLAFSRGDKRLLKRGNTYMVFPYIDHDLAGLLENKAITFNVSQIKLYSKQLLLGTAYLHRNKILHRDLKAANLLISNEGQLMIADFGLARSIEQQHNTKKREYTNCVVTRWYRPPEILLGNRRYGTPVDMWGIGCVIAEMFKGGPILTGSTDVNQCELIFRLCGSPTTESMAGWEKLPGCEGVRAWASKPRRVREEYERVSPELADLLDHLLVLDPSKRFTAEEALDHDWFWTDPMAIDPTKLPHYEPSHEYDRRKRQEQSKKTHQHQIASFTEIQGSSSNMSAKLPGAQQPLKSHNNRLLSNPSNARPGENLSLPADKYRHPDALPPAGNRMPYDSCPPVPVHQGSINHGNNPYSSQGMGGMMVNNDVRGDGRNPYDYSSRRMQDGNRGGGPSGLPSHPYQVPPPMHAGGSMQPMGGSVPPIGSYGHASLPLRPVSNFDRGMYDSMRPAKPAPPMSMMGGVVNGVMGGMGPAPPYGHPHPPPPSRHPDPYMLMSAPPPRILGEGDDRNQRGDVYPKMSNGYSQHSMMAGGGGGGGVGPMRNGYNNSGYRSRGPGRPDGRSRNNHDRWTPSDMNLTALPGGGGATLPPVPGAPPGINGYPNERYHRAGRDDRRYRNNNNNNSSSHESNHRGKYPPFVGANNNNNRHQQYPGGPTQQMNMNDASSNPYSSSSSSSYNHNHNPHLPNIPPPTTNALENDLNNNNHDVIHHNMHLPSTTTTSTSSSSNHLPHLHHPQHQHPLGFLPDHHHLP